MQTIPGRHSASSASSSPTELGYRPDIDGLRGVAVLAVVFFHAFPTVIKGGFVGVDVFFVISGYLITSLLLARLQSQKFTFADFYARRARRIFPALAVVLCSTLGLGWFTLLASEYKLLGKQVAGGAGFIANLLLWRESGYFDRAAEVKPLLHLWSLGIEEQFYFVWPVVLLVAWRRQVRLPRRVGRVGRVGLVGLIMGGSFALNLIATVHSPVAAFYSPLTRFWELLLGGLLSCLPLHRRQFFSRRADRVSAAGGALLAVALLAIDSRSRFPGGWALLPSGGAFLLIAAGPKGWLNRNLLASRWLVWFGLISYPLYLWHWPLLAFAHILALPPLRPAVSLLLLATSLGLAFLTYTFVERPIRTGRVGRLRAPLVLGVLSAVMACVGLFGYATYSGQGWAFRAANRGASYDWEAGYRYKHCFVDSADAQSGALAFAADCAGPARTAARPLVFLWGDSHAAALYPGLQAQAQRSGFDLAQFTASGCPPVLGFEVKNRKMCGEINLHVLQKIRELKPELLVMAGYWSMYSGKKDWEVLDFAELPKTVQKVRASGAGRVVVFGHLPTFVTDQPRIGARVFRPHATDRTYAGIEDSIFEYDTTVRRAAAQAGVPFVSPLELLCNPGGCLMSTSTSELLPVAWDYGHLTQDGSTLLIERAIATGGLVLPGPQPVP